MNDIGIYSIIKTIINLFFGILALLLVVRLLFRLFGANPTAGFTQFIYNSTAPFVAPFQNIFPAYNASSANIFEFSTLLALIIYMIIAYFLSRLVDMVTTPRTMQY